MVELVQRATPVQTAGLRVNLRVEGAGPPLLFLGGSNYDMSLRAPVFSSELMGAFTVASADPRGLGLTDAPDGDWRMQDYARDALDLLDVLGWQKADVLGESFGAMTALHLAALAPERINRIALSAGAAGGQGGSSYPIHEFQNIADPRSRARAALEILDSRFADLAAAEAEKQVEARSASDAVFMAHGANAQNHPRLLRARAGHDAWDHLPNITAPTLVFAGRYDMQAPPDRAENIACAMPNAALHMIEGGHGICFATPDPVSIILKDWT